MKLTKRKIFIYREKEHEFSLSSPGPSHHIVIAWIPLEKYVSDLQ
jgi:hypothetical protein